MKKFLILFIAAMLLVSALAEGSHVTVGNTTQVSGAFFTAQFGNNTSDVDVRMMVHGLSPIFWNDQVTFSVDSQVVESVESSTTDEGNVLYTIHIFDDLLWNDGTPINAKDYVFSHLLLASSQFSAIGAKTGAWKHIVGYEEYLDGIQKEFSGVRLIDDYTYSVTIKKEYEPYFLQLSYLEIYPYPISVIAPGCEVKDDGEGAYIDGEFSKELLESTILGEDGYLVNPTLSAGPYRLTGYDSATGTVEFEINEYYKGDHAGNLPTIETVTLIPVTPEEAKTAIADGKVDILNKLVDKDVIDANSDSEAKAYSYPRLGYGYISFACERGPLQFEAVRQALACAFDENTFIDETLGDYGTRVYGHYGIGQWMYMVVVGNKIPDALTEADKARWLALNLDKLDKYEYDLSRAITLLEEDGWTLNENGESWQDGDIRCKDVDGTLMKLELSFALCKDNPMAENAMVRLEQGLEALGGRLEVTEISFTELLSDYYREDGERRYDMRFMASNYTHNYDPYVAFYSGEDFDGQISYSGLDDDDLHEAAYALHSVKPGDYYTYLKRWVEFEKVYNELLPTLPIYSNVYYDFTNERVDFYPIQPGVGWAEAIIRTTLADSAQE
ncbi:MAG: ABC transporter substrate-binding protein [Clostridia bacterium]|nr:ABC transporter substrate-binding protein [Clostridia bacterium]MBR5379546.1 ABC transporter substrate-binding protein [Clostridia bacterium]